MPQNTTLRQRRMIEALLSGLTIADACKTIGIDRKTYYRWLSESPAFREALRQTESELLTSAMRALLNLQSEAVGVLAGMLTDKRLPPNVRLAAARTVLDAALKTREAADFEARLAVLETKLDELTERTNQNG